MAGLPDWAWDLSPSEGHDIFSPLLWRGVAGASLTGRGIFTRPKDTLNNFFLKYGEPGRSPLLFYYIMLVIFLIFLSSCDLTSGKRHNENFIVITANIYAGEYITKDNPILITRSISVNGGSLDMLLVDDALVTIQEKETEISCRLRFFIDYKSGAFGYYDPLESILVESSKTYVLTVKVQGVAITAETTVPDEFMVLPNAGYTTDGNATFPSMIHKTIDELYPIEIKVDKQENIPIFVEYYCLEDWPYVMYVYDDWIGDMGPATEEDYEGIMDGFPRRNTFYATAYPHIDENGFVITVPFSQLNYFFYGEYRTTVMRIDENYFKYLYKSEGYLHGGVQGGIGYFGSASRITLYTKIVKQ